MVVQPGKTPRSVNCSAFEVLQVPRTLLCVCLVPTAISWGVADLCIEEDIEMPGLAPDKQTVEEGRKQIGRIMGKLFDEKTDLTFDEFKVVKREETTKTMVGNPQKLIRYTFTLNTTTP
jgi:hypothetical protein